MSRSMRLIGCALALTLCTGYALAATTTPPADTLKVDYFSNANTGDPDGTLRITNPGTSGGNLCPAIYVFDPAQELSECCSCLVTPNGLRTLSVNTDLTKNPLTGVALTTGSIRIVSSTESGGTCLLPYQGRVTPTAGIRSWTTHIQSATAITETASQDATFSATELNQLETACYAIAVDGSGAGLCTCGTGD